MAALPFTPLPFPKYPYRKGGSAESGKTFLVIPGKNFFGRVEILIIRGEPVKDHVSPVPPGDPPIFNPAALPDRGKEWNGRQAQAVYQAQGEPQSHSTDCPIHKGEYPG
jgi:hypothetical protein